MRSRISNLLSVIYTQLLKFILLKKVNFGKRVWIYHRAKINIISGKLYIGDNVRLGRSRYGYHGGMPFHTTCLIDKSNAEITIGNNCRINGAYIHAQKSIIIGENCVIASGVNILDSNGHAVNSMNRTIGRDEPGTIIIGNNVWIGLNVTILKNTYIGDNCVISAGSVVHGKFESNSIIKGVPAITAQRFEFSNSSNIYDNLRP
jgi:acetyltransferase-like isoleucine patch superfamily enzyme